MDRCRQLLEQFDLKQLTDSTLSKDIISACIQADASIRSAELQASATNSGDIATVITGIITFIAGVLAYFAATKSLRADQRRRQKLTLLYPKALDLKLIQRMKALQAVAKQLDEQTAAHVRATFLLVLPSFSEKLSPRWDESGYDLILFLGTELIERISNLDYTTQVVCNTVARTFETSDVDDPEIKRFKRHFDNITKRHWEIRKLLRENHPRCFKGKEANLPELPI